MRRLNLGTASSVASCWRLRLRPRATTSCADDAVHAVDDRVDVTMVGLGHRLHGRHRRLPRAPALAGRAATRPTRTRRSSPARTRASAATSGSPPTTRSSASSTSCVTMILLGVGGTLAMMIRTDLITPNSGFLGPQTYNSARRAARADDDPRHDHHGHRPVRELHRADHDRRAGHGLPAAQRAEPVAARRDACRCCSRPRSSAASRPAGSGYAPLADQAPPGMDAYLDGDHHLRDLQRDRGREHHHDDPDDARPRA